MWKRNGIQCRCHHYIYYEHNPLTNLFDRTQTCGLERLDATIERIVGFVADKYALVNEDTEPVFSWGLFSYELYKLTPKSLTPFLEVEGSKPVPGLASMEAPNCMKSRGTLAMAMSVRSAGLLWA